MTINDLTIKKIVFNRLLNELPEFYELKNVIENNNWHHNESTFDHTLKVLSNYIKFFVKSSDKISKYLNKKVDKYQIKDLIYLAVILHDLGKKETIIKSGDKSSFPLHEKISVAKSKKILNKFNFSASEKNFVLEIIKQHSYLHSIVEPDNKNLEQQFNGLKKKMPQYIVGLVILVMADTINSYLKETMPKKYKFRISFYKEKLNSLV